MPVRSIFGALAVVISACGPTADPPDADAAPVDTGMADTAPTDTGVADTLVDAPSCVAVDETCNGMDDDCDGAVDESFDLMTDARHCGGCGDVCVGASRQAPSCGAGECAAVCLAGFEDCNAMDVDGCESDLNEPATCGDCGNACVAGQVCAAGVCEDSCPGDTADCDGSCVDFETDISHCGGCEAECPSVPGGVPTCMAGMCIVGSCDTGWADCNGEIGDGCETNLRGSTAHCGACGASCAPGQGCSAGACVAGSSSCSALADWTFGSGGAICRGMCLDYTIQCTSGACGCSRAGVTLTCPDDATCMDVASSGCCFGPAGS